MFIEVASVNKSINCCSVTDSNYIRPTTVTVASICKNNYDVVVNYFIVLNGIEITDKRLSCLLQLTNKYKNLVIRLIPVNSENLIPLDIQEKIGKTLISSRLTLSVYLRLFLAEILPTTIDRVLYLDSDVLCLGGVLPLYTANLDGIPLLGVEDIHSVKHTKRLNLSAYINSGVLLINLKYWRDKGVINNFYQHITDDCDLIKLHDQDVINLTFDNSIRMVSNVWNYQFLPIPQNKEITSVRLLHFISEQKPWIRGNVSPYRKVWTDFCKHCLNWGGVCEDSFSLVERLIYKLQFFSFYFLPLNSKRRDVVKGLLSKVKALK